jgi:hypothetical protein
MYIYLTPLVVAIIGVVIYVLATTNAKAAEIGRILFWTGMLAFLLGAPHLVGVVH